MTMTSEKEERLRTAYEAISEMDEAIDQAAFLNEFLDGKPRTPGSEALVNAVAMNLADEL